jgi:hypothetical protein
MKEAFAGIDVAFAKKKRLPVAVCTIRGTSVEPLPLRTALVKPPVGSGNARILEHKVVEDFADETAIYLSNIQTEFGVKIRRIGIDAPRTPKTDGTARRLCEIGLDRLAWIIH